MVAGWGSFPIEVAERCAHDCIKLHVVGLNGHADPKLQALANDFRWSGVAKLGSHIRYFRRCGINEVAFAGKLFKNQLLYHGLGWLKLLPDWTCTRTLASTFLTRTKNGCDDTILGAVVDAYQRKGIRIMTIHETVPSLLVGEGIIVGRKLSRSQMADIQFGWNVAKKMGELDIGQSITVKDQMVLGVEAIEGTDGLIQRTGQHCPKGGFTLVKLAKPHQDMRFDVPAIGPRTVEQMAAAGGKLVAIESNKTILLQRNLTLETARRLGVTIVAISDAHAQTSRDLEDVAA